MSKKENLQNKFNNFSIYLGTFLASFVAIIGYIISSFNKIEMWLLVFCIVGLCVVASIIAVIQLHLNNINNEIERL